MHTPTQRHCVCLRKGCTGFHCSGIVLLLSAIGRSRAWAAGATWTCVIDSAPWAARWDHTSVIDAAGAIYVIGGTDGTFFNDVWASTGGGTKRNQGACKLA
jgi:hypothetical protein